MQQCFVFFPNRPGRQKLRTVAKLSKNNSVCFKTSLLIPCGKNIQNTPKSKEPWDPTHCCGSHWRYSKACSELWRTHERFRWKIPRSEMSRGATCPFEKEESTFKPKLAITLNRKLLTVLYTCSFVSSIEDHIRNTLRSSSQMLFNRHMPQSCTTVRLISNLCPHSRYFFHKCITMFFLFLLFFPIYHQVFFRPMLQDLQI